MNKPRGKVNCNWSSNLAYAIGLIATDGCLSKDGRHLELTSTDEDQLENFMSCLGIKVKIGYKTSSFSHNKIPRIQFGDILFYRFLESIGLTTAKTKTISALKIPDEYFYDFLRGHHDGDGTFYSYWDPRWKSSFMFYTVFLSTSKPHVVWIQKKIFELLGIKGHLTINRSRRGHADLYQIRYAKKDSLKLLPKMYYSDKIITLKRKRLKIVKALAIDAAHARVL